MAHIEQSLSKLLKDDLPRLELDYQGKFDSVLKTVKIYCIRVRAPCRQNGY